MSNQSDYITAKNIVERHIKHLTESVEATQDQDQADLVVALEVVLFAAERLEKCSVCREDIQCSCNHEPV